jgi:hypothetical protein
MQFITNNISSFHLRWNNLKGYIYNVFAFAVSTLYDGFHAPALDIARVEQLRWDKVG